MSSTVTERKAEIAERIGADANRIDTVQLDIQKMRELGTLVDIDLHGFSMFTRRATWSELGIDVKSVRRKRLKRGSKDMLPKQFMSTLRSLESRFRQCLDRHSFVLEGFRPWRWVPFTAYAEWQDEWGELQAELDNLKSEIIDRRDEFADDLASDFSAIADEAWRAISASRPDGAGDFALITKRGSFDNPDAFREYVVARAEAQLPSAEEIDEGLYVSYRNAMVATGADVEAEKLRQEKLEAERATEWQRKRTVAEEEHAKRQQIRHRAELRKRERERRLELMHTAELEHAKEQLAETVNPFREVIEQFRAQIYQDVLEIRDSIERNGYVHGRTASRAAGLLDTYKLLGAATGDEELELLLAGGCYWRRGVGTVAGDVAGATEQADRRWQGQVRCSGCGGRPERHR